MECIFCNIVERKAPADITHEDERCLVFRDIHPEAPVHLLVIPKKHVSSLLELEDTELGGTLLLCAKAAARKAGLTGYRVRINVGKQGGQIIDHLHLHVLGEPAKSN
ncbi:MAG: HIT domain-containing protein [Candidatus Yanofskybacteria bacterium]|nr:HIT domain-containing protein [Candidatus Yanofskybacteria bacterium]